MKKLILLLTLVPVLSFISSCRSLDMMSFKEYQEQRRVIPDSISVGNETLYFTKEKIDSLNFIP